MRMQLDRAYRAEYSEGDFLVASSRPKRSARSETLLLHGDELLIDEDRLVFVASHTGTARVSHYLNTPDIFGVWGLLRNMKNDLIGDTSYDPSRSFSEVPGCVEIRKDDVESYSLGWSLPFVWPYPLLTLVTAARGDRFGVRIPHSKKATALAALSTWLSR